MVENIFAGIVLYNPEIPRLKENIEAVSGQVARIILVDNGSSNIEDIKPILQEYKNIVLIQNEKNLGIAAALNQLLSYAIEHRVQWLLTLDQDSVVTANFLKNMLLPEYPSNTAMITPNILDRNDQKGLLLQPNGVVSVDECITSGTIMHIGNCKQVGWFDEKMFIDYVDFEYCYRVRQCGYDIFRNNDVVLIHQLGDGQVASFLGKRFMVANHSPLRHYYVVRNCVYLIKKHGWALRGGRSIFQEFFIVLGYEKNRISKLKCMFKGALDGVRL